MVLSIVVVSGLTVGVAQTASAESAGADIYAENCAGCHAEDGSGGVGPAVAGSEYVMDDAAVVAQIFYGSGFMPPYDFLSDEEVADLVNYMRTEWNSADRQIDASYVASQRP